MLILEFIIIQTLIFVVIFFVLRRLMIQNTTSAVNRLRFADEENAKRLEEVRAKIEAAEVEYKHRIAELEADLEKQRETAKKQAEEERDGLLAKAREESERILGAAKNRADNINQETASQMQSLVATQSLDIVRKFFGQQKMTAFNEQLIDEFLGEVETVDTGHVPEEVSKVEVVTSYPLSPDRKQRIAALLKQKLGRAVELKETVKDDMVGGMVISLGSIVMDGSLENRLGEIIRDLNKQK